ncbi:MAG: hypothetical protein ACREAI_00770, partial [Nitrososphaera sp.]
IHDKDERAARKQELNGILDTKAKSMSRDGRERHYSDLLDGRFEVQVYRIERMADGKRDIYGKAFDFSAVSIAELMDQGEKDALKHIEDEKIAW